MKAAVTYAAKSSPDEKGSIDTQLADCRAMAGREGWKVAGEYTDENFTAWQGRPRTRPRRSPGSCRARLPAILIVQHSDRLAREAMASRRGTWSRSRFGRCKSEVEIRSVQDPATFENLVMAVVMGERNTEDSPPEV